MVDSEKDVQMKVTETETVASVSALVLPLASGQEKTKTTEERLMEVMADIEKQKANDDLVFACIREELDFIADSKKRGQNHHYGIVN